MKITVASPCSESWDAMSGDDRMRYCGRCRLNVYNFSSMTEEQLEALIGSSEGQVCARFFQRKDGTVLTQDCPVGWRRKVGKRIAVVAALILGVLVSVMAFGQDRVGEMPDWIRGVLDWFDPPPRAVMGTPCPPSPPAPQGGS